MSDMISHDIIGPGIISCNYLISYGEYDVPCIYMQYIKFKQRKFCISFHFHLLCLFIHPHTIVNDLIMGIDLQF